MIRLVVRGGQQEITAQAPTLDHPKAGTSQQSTLGRTVLGSWRFSQLLIRAGASGRRHTKRTGCGGTGNGDRHVVIEDPASPEQPVQVGARPTFSKK